MDAEPAQGLFLGVGVDHYSSAELTDLPGSADEVEQIAHLVGNHFGVCVLRDADEAEVRRELRARAAHFSDDDAALVMVWSGHGRPGANPTSLRLLAHDSPNSATGGLDAVEVATEGAATGAAQILFIVDTCFAGNAFDALVQVNNHFRASPPAGEWSWFGMLAACGPETVRQRLLSPAIQRLLRDGPQPDGVHAQDIRRRWSVHQRLIRGDDLCDAVIKEWDPSLAPTEPRFASIGDARPVIRNPLWSPTAGPLSVGEVLTSVRPAALFFGRHGAVATVSGWVNHQPRGVYVIAGAAGSGKSALLNHALSLQADDGGEGASQPAAGTAAPVIVDVGGLSTQLIAAAIDRILVASTVLDEAPAARNAFELCGGLQRRGHTGAAVPVIALDGLTEAAEPARVAEELIAPLSTVATVIVTTRPKALAVPRQRRPSEPGQWSAAGDTVDLVSIAAVLTSPERILDLDDEEHRISGWNAIEELLDDRLGGGAPEDDPAGTFAALRQEIGNEGPPPFVLATLIIDHAREAGVANLSQMAGSVTGSVGAALDQLVARTYDPSTSNAARRLLNALPSGLGAGLPETEWLAIANADPTSDERLDREDVAAVLAPMGDYIVEDSESDQAVYRFAHTLIAQHFAQQARANVDEQDLALRIATALVEHRVPTDSSAEPIRSPHLRRYLWRYVARAGEPGLQLLAENPAHQADLTAATLAVSIEASQRGDLVTAARTAEQASTVAANLTGSDRAQRLAPALAHLATVYQFSGQITKAVDAGRRAVATYGQLIEQHPEMIIEFAAATHNFANMLMDAEDPVAVTAAAQAVDLEEQFLQRGGDNRYRLGIARNTLALASSMTGRTHEAVQASRDAVDVLEAAVDINATERDRGALAQALQNLGSHLGHRGDVDEALTVTERAHAIMEDLVAIDDTWRPALLETLSDLAVRYSQAGQGERALTLAAQAAAGYAALASPTPAQTMNHAGALTNYANMLVASGRADAAVGPARAAVVMVAELADDQEARRPALALMLDNYANTLTRTGHHSEALQTSEQALLYYRQGREANPGLDSDVARVLSNYCHRLALAGRFTQAAAAGTEAIDIYEHLASADPRRSVDAVITRADVAAYTAQAGNTRDAAKLAAQATNQGEQLATTGALSLAQLATLHVQATKATAGDPASAARYAERAVDLFREAGLSETSEYATALRNLAALHGMAKRTTPGLAAIDEAVAIFTRLVEVDSSHRVDLASALATRARLLLEARRSAAARDTAITAVEHYRRIPELSFDSVDQCAKALATLAIALRDLGETTRLLEEQVEQCVQHLDVPQRAQLLYTVVDGLPMGHPLAPAWIHQAVNDLGSADPMLRLQIGRLTRRLRSANPPGFDQLWRQAAGAPVPEWARIDEQKIAWVMRWVTTANYTDAEAFLRRHRHLLGHDYDGAVDEVFIAVDPARASALRDIRARLATATATQPAAGAALDVAETFLNANLAQRVTLLDGHGQHLLDDAVGRYLRARDDSPRARAAVSLIELYRIGRHTDVVAAAADADQTESVLADIAEHHDVKVLRQAAVVLMDNAGETGEHEVGVVASFFFGAGMMSTEYAAQGRELIPLAAEVVPLRVPGWRRLCQRLAPATPEFAEVAALLEEAPGQRG